MRKILPETQDHRHCQALSGALWKTRAHAVPMAFRTRCCSINEAKRPIEAPTGNTLD